MLLWRQCQARLLSAVFIPMGATKLLKSSSPFTFYQSGTRIVVSYKNHQPLKPSPVPLFSIVETRMLETTGPGSKLHASSQRSVKSSAAAVSIYREQPFAGRLAEEMSSQIGFKSRTNNTLSSSIDSLALSKS